MRSLSSSRLSSGRFSIYILQCVQTCSGDKLEHQKNITRTNTSVLFSLNLSLSHVQHLRGLVLGTIVIDLFHSSRELGKLRI